MKTQIMLLTFILGMASLSFGEGPEAQNGGHGVDLPSGDTVSLDLLEGVDEGWQDVSKEPLNIFQHQATQKAAEEVISILSIFKIQFPSFHEALIDTFQNKMTWVFVDQPLRLVEDHELTTPFDLKLRQLALQFERGKVAIHKESFMKLDTKNQAVLLTHELLLSKLGLRVSRKNLRIIIRCLFQNSPNQIENIIALFNEIDPEILRGNFHVVTELSILSWRTYLWIAYGEPNTEGQFRRCIGETGWYNSRGELIDTMSCNFTIPGNGRELSPHIVSSDDVMEPGYSQEKIRKKILKIYVNGVLYDTNHIQLEDYFGRKKISLVLW